MPTMTQSPLVVEAEAPEKKQRKDAIVHSGWFEGEPIGGSPLEGVHVLLIPPPSQQAYDAPPEVPSLQAIAADQLRIDPDYQRPRSDLAVKRLATVWDPAAAGALIVNERPTGDGYVERVVIDGQHRLAAFLACHQPEEPMLCLAYRGLSVEREAAIFIRCNLGRANVNPLWAFKARLKTGDPIAVALDEIVSESGLQLQQKAYGNAEAGEINSYQALERAYRLEGRIALAACLFVARQAFGEQEGAITREVIRGLSWLFAVHGSSIDKERLISVLKRKGAMLWRADALAVRATLGGEAWTCAARVWWQAYNDAGRTKLPPLFDQFGKHRF